MNGDSRREMRQLERCSSSGVVFVLQGLHMVEWSCLDED